MGKLCGIWDIQPAVSCRLSGGVTVQHLAYGLFNGSDLFGIGHFLTVKITDVKDINDLIYLGGNLGDPDIQFAPEQGVGDLVEKPRKVVGVDLYDGEKIRTTVVNDNFVGS